MLIYVDRTNRKLYSDIDSQRIVTLSPFYQFDITNFSVVVVEPSGSSFKTLNNPSDYVYISIGVPGVQHSNVLTYNTLSYNAASGSYDGNLSISGSNTNTLLTNSSSLYEVPVYFELKMSNNGDANKKNVIYQEQSSIIQNIIKS